MEKIWDFSPYSELLLDPYIEGTGLSGGRLDVSFIIVDFIFQRIIHRSLKEKEDGVGGQEESNAPVCTGDVCFVPPKKKGGEEEETKSKDGSESELFILTEEEKELLEKAQRLIRQCTLMAIAGKQAEKSSQLRMFVELLIHRLSALNIGEMMLIPGGWQSQKFKGIAVYWVHRTDSNSYSFVMCNPSPDGLAYHPSHAASDPHHPKVFFL